VIQRIEIDKRGGISLQTGGHGQWYDFSVFPPRALDPLQDPAIPLSGLARERGLEVLGYRPARRLVAAGRRDGVDLVWKGYRRGKVGEQSRKYQLAAKALHGGEVGTVSILEVDPEGDSMTMRREPGQRPHIAADCQTELQLMGAGTRRLQALDAGSTALEAFTRQQELDVLTERIRRLGLAGGSPPIGWEVLRGKLEDAASLAPPAQAVTAHRDLHDGQWLVHRGRPCLLDFDLLCRAEPELDPANFLAHLELRRLQRPAHISDRDLQACRGAFLAGLGLPNDSGSVARLLFYQSAAFARLALVYQLRPRWEGLVQELIALGQKRLADLRSMAH
jgi:hypothetical protein